MGSHTVLMAGTIFGSDCVAGDRCAVRERCTIGDSVVVGSGAVVENDTSIGSRTRIQTGAYITAYMTIEEDVFIAPMVVTTNDNFMGRTPQCREMMRGQRSAGALVSAAALTSCRESRSVRTRLWLPLPWWRATCKAHSVVMGSPARVVRNVPPDQLLENQ